MGLWDEWSKERVAGRCAALRGYLHIFSVFPIVVSVVLTTPAGPRHESATIASNSISHVIR
jgi:hypothetical protein